MNIQGRTWKFGDDINTDLIIPARHMNVFDPEQLGRHCMEDADPQFPTRVRAGDIIVAGTNFGCGSSREHAVLALKGAGVAAVIAVSFARIFFRNAINTGLPIVESPEAVAGIDQGDEIRLDLVRGRLANITTGEEFTITPFPEFLTDIVQKGGLLPWAQTELEKPTA